MHPHHKYINALLNNDMQLLGELYRNCFPVIRSMVLQNKGTEAAAADLFQDALVDLLRKAKSGSFALRFSICSYIKGMCMYKWRDELEKRKREGVTFTGFEGQDEIGEDCFATAEAHYLKQARLDLIKKKMAELGAGCQELVRLSWAKNAIGKRKSTEEIAEALHISGGYVRKKKSECIGKLIRLVMADPEFKKL